MNFSIEAGELARIIGAVKGCIPPRTTMPILSHVLLEATAGSVSARATCFDMEATAHAKADVAVDGKAALPGDILHGLARRLPKSGLVTIALDGAVANMTSGRASYRLGALPTETFPVVGNIEGLTLHIPAQDLRSILASTMPATSDTSTWYHRGIHLHTVTRPDLRIAAVATDDHRMAYREMAAPEGLDTDFAVTIPERAAREMVSLLEGVEGNARLTISETRVVLQCADAELSLAVLDGKYPAYGRVLPEPNGAIMSVKPAELVDAVERAILAAPWVKDRVAAVGLVAGISGLNILSGTRGQEEANEVIDADVHERADGELSINAAYLTQMLKIWPEVPVEIQSAGPGHPILFWSKEVPAMRHAIMPMKR